ncbi:hypothetical protein CBS101457_003544 [Exobasidium rhododendri]|nr:hypothetical protein CBS101457_003544 [Exobasidium rhododendri]
MQEVELLWQSAGQEAASRCAAIEKADEESVENADWERELQSFIPHPGSSLEYTQLRRLRALLHKGENRFSADLSSNSSKAFEGSHLDRRRQSITREKGKDGKIIETELYWSATRLIWSRGGIVVRSFSYEEEVKCACWAWMDSDSTWEATEAPAHVRSSDRRNVASTSNLPVKEEKNNSISRLQETFRQTAFVKNKRLDSRKLFRALCVFLPSCLVIYHPHSGKEFIKRVDMEVCNVYPLKRGILIQRKTEVEDRKRAKMIKEGNTSADLPLPTLFYLRRPYDELKGMSSVKSLRFTRKGSNLLSASVRKGEIAQSFNEVEEEVIFVSVVPPVMVSLSRKCSSLRIYAYGHDRSPFHQYEDTLGEDSLRSQLSEEQSKLSSGKARRSTLEGQQRSRPGARPKMPPRKSSRVDSVSGRSSMGGPRSSLGGDRTRNMSSSLGHTRRQSGGLPAIHGQSALLHDEEEQKRNEDENLQEVMQLLDEFDEAEEQSNDRQQLPYMTPRTVPNTVMRRRASRGTLPSSGITPGSIANNTRTPFTKSWPTEERKISRSRKSTLLSNTAEGVPVSVAVELSQKDEASKIAMSANGEKAVVKGLNADGTGNGEESHLMQEGLSIFQQFAQGFAVVSLLEQISVPEIHR